MLDYYRKYICSNPEWKFVGIYADEGITGTNTKKRDGFNSMINDAKAGKIDKLEFWRVLTCNSTHTSLRGGLRGSATSETSPKSTLLRWRLFLRSTSAMRCKKVKLAFILNHRHPPVKNRLPGNRQAAYCLLYFHHL